MKGLFRGSRYDLKTRFSLSRRSRSCHAAAFRGKWYSGKTYVVQKGVYPPGIPAFGFASSNAPVVGLDALFRTELAKFAVYGDACHNHNLAVFLFRTFLQIKKNLECRFHNSKFLVAKLVFTSRFRVMQTMD